MWEMNDMNRHVMYQQFITWDDKVGDMPDRNDIFTGSKCVW